MSVWLALSLAVSSGLVGDVRSAIARHDFPGAEACIRDYRAARGVTPEMLEAMSWLGRGALAEKHAAKAEGYASETHKLALEMLKSRGLDADKSLPVALGASIEVQAQVLAGRGERSAAVEFLARELETYRNTSIRTRIQKNLHLLSLEGKPAPPLEGLKGPALLFFWAHWCPDCKEMAPVLAQLARDYAPRGLAIVAPTQRYGYTRRGEEASPEAELKYIEQVRARFYSAVPGMTAPVNEENFRNYGASTTPTLVLVDRGGIVRMYHPGSMDYEALRPVVAAWVR